VTQNWDDRDLARLAHLLKQAADDLNAAQIIPGVDAYSRQNNQRPYVRMTFEKARAVAVELAQYLGEKVVT